MIDNFPLQITGYFDDSGGRFTLTAPFVYDDPEKDIRVEIPEGFQTDFNSVPRALQAYFPKWQYLEAGLVHDWLYRAPNGFQSHSYKPPLTRQQCDDLHRRILHLKGCRWTKRQAAYLALRSGGWKPWNAYRDAEAQP